MGKRADSAAILVGSTTIGAAVSKINPAAGLALGGAGAIATGAVLLTDEKRDDVGALLGVLACIVGLVFLLAGLYYLL